MVVILAELDYGLKETLSQVQFGMTMQNIVKQILFKVVAVLEK